jgi:CheY-like chemotaxis protein
LGGIDFRSIREKDTMSKSGPIILIDDDHDDKDLFLYVIKSLEIKNELIYFDNCKDALDYLKMTTQQPFIIFCDINLPHTNGIELKKMIDKDPEMRKKSIPFVFYSTSVDPAIVTKAYLEMTIQGFFQKAMSVDQMKKDIQQILEYWLLCRHPNSTH